MDRTLIIIRHAKTEKEHPEGDHERELAERGVADAKELGHWLAAEGLLPDVVLTSTATRARQTTEHVLGGAGVEDAEIWPGGALYQRGTEGVLGAVREAPDDSSVVWAVGHEPTLSTLILALADALGSVSEVLSSVGEKFPTATAAVLRVPVPWAELGEGMARLEAVHKARA